MGKIKKICVMNTSVSSAFNITVPCNEVFSSSVPCEYGLPLSPSSEVDVMSGVATCISSSGNSGHNQVVCSALPQWCMLGQLHHSSQQPLMKERGTVFIKSDTNSISTRLIA
jgi:hypothetical protein